MISTLLLALVFLQPPRTVGPDDIRRAAATLMLLNAARSPSADDEALKKAVKAFLDANPGFESQSLPELLKNAPNLPITPEVRAKATEMAREFMNRPTSPAPRDGEDVKPDSARQVPKPPDEARPPEEAEPPRPESTGDPNRPNGANPPASGPAPQPRPAAPPDDRGGEAIRWWEKNVGPLDKTPAFKGVVEEFIRGVSPGSPSRGPLGKLLTGENGKVAGEWAAAIGKALGGLKSDASGAAADLPGAPSFGAPSGEGTARVGVLLAVLGALVAAAFFWRRGPSGSVGQRSALGRVSAPKPSSIRDRETLIAAFDRLGRHKLGPDADHLHHRALGRTLRERGAPDAAVREWVDAYEQARYAPDEFAAGRVTVARDALAAILGARQ